MARRGTLVVPNCDGSATTPPEPRSDVAAALPALNGAKKSVVLRLPSACTTTRAMASSSGPGSVLPGMAFG